MRDILVVEDGASERERLERLFLDANFSVDAVESVQEAERLLNLDKYRLAILDIGLSDKSGSYLFESLRRSKRASYVIILTGNPSVHLKQRFLDEGASAYIVKASAAAENRAILETVQGLLGSVSLQTTKGISLEDFLRLCVNGPSRGLFLNDSGEIPACTYCGCSDYIVSFADKTQLPPVVEGRVICGSCKKEMNPKIG
ncbi:MAG: response regulator [Deltaproteobacteria bacterium]|nr:response regulator [Deltaproteobacteria bacterium]